jgi:hypothetical protein
LSGCQATSVDCPSFVTWPDLSRSEATAAARGGLQLHGPLHPVDPPRMKFPSSRTRDVFPTPISEDATTNDCSACHKKNKGNGVKNPFLTFKIDTPEERHGTKLHTQQTHCTASTQLSTKHFARSARPLNQPGISMSSTLTCVAPALETVSNPPTVAENRPV